MSFRSSSSLMTSFRPLISRTKSGSSSTVLTGPVVKWWVGRVVADLVGALWALRGVPVVLAALRAAERVTGAILCCSNSVCMIQEGAEAKVQIKEWYVCYGLDKGHLQSFLWLVCKKIRRCD